jgi:hypothetical protein
MSGKVRAIFKLFPFSVLRLVGFAGVCITCSAQASGGWVTLTKPSCLSYTLRTQTDPLSAKQKWCYWAQNRAFTASGFFGAALSAGLAQYQNEPPEWGQGMAGYARRFGTRYTQNLLKNTIQTSLEILDHEEPRPYLPGSGGTDHDHTPKSGYAQRLGHALLGTVWVHRDQDKPRSDFVSFSRIAGAFASGFIGMTWTPTRDNSLAAAFGRTGTAMAGYAGSNVLHEFQPDIINVLGKLFGKGKSANTTQSNTGDSRE